MSTCTEYHFEHDLFCVSKSDTKTTNLEIHSAMECKEAAKDIGAGFHGSHNAKYRPPGCYLKVHKRRSGEIELYPYFNRHSMSFQKEKNLEKKFFKRGISEICKKA